MSQRISAQCFHDHANAKSSAINFTMAAQTLPDKDCQINACYANAETFSCLNALNHDLFWIKSSWRLARYQLGEDSKSPHGGVPCQPVFRLLRKEATNSIWSASVSMAGRTSSHFHDGQNRVHELKSLSLRERINVMYRSHVQDRSVT